MTIEIDNIARSPSRCGRELQRYHSNRRQVVGCIPYRYDKNSGISSSIVDEIEVLLISSQKCETMMFPKGGWESDESMQDAVLRETLEEAGVTGIIQSKLGEWIYKSKSQEKMHDGHMFALLVEQQLEEWPEKNARQRRWVKVQEAKNLCPHQWMKEALDSLINKLLDLDDLSETEESSTPRNDLIETEESSTPRNDLSETEESSTPRNSEAQSNTVSSDMLSPDNTSTKLEMENGDLTPVISSYDSVVNKNDVPSFINKPKRLTQPGLCIDLTSFGNKRDLLFPDQRRNVKRHLEVLQPC